MVRAICINDSNKPKEIPEGKWLKKGNEYSVIYSVTVLPQHKLAFHLAEIDLDESCSPYTYFLADRFAFGEEDILKLMQLIKDCSDTDFSMDELLNKPKYMKAKLEYNLPDDKNDFDLAVRASDLFSVLWELNQELRRLIKYAELSEEQYKVVEDLREKFNDLLFENKINLDA